MTRKVITFKEYQTVMTDILTSLKFCAIWAQMGLGKTVAVLTAYYALWTAGEETKPMLVIAPLRVAQTTWVDEVAEWDHLQDLRITAVVSPNEKERRKLLHDGIANKSHVFTINYENIPWLIEELKSEWIFGTVCLDEATKVKGLRLSWQVSKLGKKFIKGQGTMRSKMLAKIRPRCTRFWELSGTPAPNGLKDLWGQLWFIDYGTRLGRTYASFEDRWFRMKRGGHGIEPMPHAQEQIQNAVKDVCISFNAKDYFDLKDPIVNNRFVDLPPVAMKQYKEMQKDYFTTVEEQGVEAVNSAAKSMKLLQLANGAVYLDKEGKTWGKVHDLKLEALDEIIEEAAGAPVLVAYTFRHDVERILKRFPQARKLDKDPQTIKDWNAGKIAILVAHPASCGHGLSLQHGGNIIAFFGHDYNLEYLLQMIERLGPVRQMQSGYDRNVFIYNIIARNTIEHKVIMPAMEGKGTVQELLMQAVKQAKGK